MFLDLASMVVMIRGKDLEVQVFSFLILCYDSRLAEAAQKGKATQIIRTAKF